MKKFIDAVITLLQEEVGEEFSIRACECKKNNGITLHGITICDENATTFITPAIYLDEYYQEYSAGQKSLEDIVAAILAINKKSAVKMPFDSDIFTDFAKARNGIMYKLVNFEKNQELLREIPYVKYLDMAVVFFYDVPDFPEEGSTGNILIRNTFMEKWGINVDDLYDAALHNTPDKYPVYVKDMQTILMKMLTKTSINEEKNAEDFLRDIVPGSVTPELYVLSTRRDCYGAACLLYPDFLKKVSEKLGTDMFILPSSVHEVLALPFSDTEDPELLKSMVKSVNMTEVSVEDYLSDNVYVYRNGDLAII